MPTPWYRTHITQGFKWRWDNTSAHSGIDLAEDQGTPLTSAVTGDVLHAGYHAWGGQVDLYFTAGGFEYVLSYLHLSEIADTIQAGGSIREGQAIGLSGGADSGPHPTERRFSSGPHLHFELTLGKKAPYIDYNPHRPTQESHPLDPTAFWTALKDNGIHNDESTFYSTVTAGSQVTSTLSEHLPGSPLAPDAGEPSSGQLASESLRDLPGFAGIVAAVDAAEYIGPYTPPQSIIPGVAGVEAPGKFAAWAVRNGTGIATRTMLVLLGVGILLAMMIGLWLTYWVKPVAETAEKVAPLALAAV